MNELVLSPSLLIPIVAIVGGVLIPIVAIVGGLLYRWNRERLLHDTIRALAEKGQPIPPELLRGGGRRSEALGGERTPLRQGIVLVAVGAGLALMFWAMKPTTWLWAVGFVPMFIGLAYLLIWKLEGKPQA